MSGNPQGLRDDHAIYSHLLSPDLLPHVPVHDHIDHEHKGTQADLNAACQFTRIEELAARSAG